MRGISWLAANQLTAQEGLCTVEWVSEFTFLVSVDRCSTFYHYGWIRQKCLSQEKATTRLLVSQIYMNAYRITAFCLLAGTRQQAECSICLSNACCCMYSLALLMTEGPKRKYYGRGIYLYSKTNQMHQCVKFILFWNNTLHVSDCLSVHHQELKTVHTATSICQTDMWNRYVKQIQNMRRFLPCKLRIC